MGWCGVFGSQQDWRRPGRTMPTRGARAEAVTTDGVMASRFLAELPVFKWGHVTAVWCWHAATRNCRSAPGQQFQL